MRISRLRLYRLASVLVLWIASFSCFAQSYEVKSLKIGKATEQVFASDYFGGKLYFCSNAKSKQSKNVINEDNTRFLNLYSIELTNDLNVKRKGKPTILPEEVNSNLNEGPIFFDKETGIAYFSSNKESDSTAISLKIYSTKIELSTGAFSLREEINLNLGDGNYSNPTVSADGNTMIFSFRALTDTSSNLYISNKENGEWTLPVPLDVNTSNNETFPRLYKNYLYFCSDRQGGFGGLDIYKCSLYEGQFGKPKLLPEPVNSASDDFLFFQTSKNEGIFSSNRGSGMDRIYKFKQDLPSPESFVETNIDFCYTMQDETILDKTKYDYIWDFGDGTKKKGGTVHHCYSDTGVYEISCHLQDIETLKIEEDIINGKVEIISELPIIRIQENAGVKTVYLEQKWSRKNFTNFYWILNDEIVSDEQLKINANHSKPFVVKAVLWNIDKPDEVIGITKSIIPSE